MSQSVTTQTEQGLYVHPEALTAHLPALDYRSGALYMEQVSIAEVVKNYGTPCYVYSKQAILDVYQAYTTSFASLPHQICYAVKANSTLAVLGILAQAGAGFDIVSRGELMRVLAAGGEAARVVFSGVGKTYSDIEYALTQGIGCFNVESISELTLINDVAKQLDKSAPISLRVNPNVDAKTHPYISTGLKNNKFGIAYDRALETYQAAASMSNLIVTGIDCHIGSQITELEPFVHAADKVLDLIEELHQAGIRLDHIDFGGGLGVRYADETPPAAAEMLAAVRSRVAARPAAAPLPLFFEPGRSLVANCGSLLMRVEYLKPTTAKNFCIVDAAMNDMMRPTLYQAEMPILPVVEREGAEVWDIVGPVCESGDFLAKERTFAAHQGDLLVMAAAGAYGMSMASNYNARPRAAEVLVDGEHVYLVRRRETTADMLALESRIPQL